MKTQPANCRCLLPLLLLTCSLTTAQAQWVTIPDTAFAHFLRVTYPTCMNGNLMDTTCNNIVNALSINCSNKNIVQLTGIQYFDKLVVLNCGGNNIYNVDTLPPTVKYMTISGNNIYVIAKLPPGLIRLRSVNNLLGSLPALPATLKTLESYQSVLTSLPALPAGLDTLDCRNNRITSLPALPASLRYLNCDDNNLTALPALPASLIYLNCGTNSITSLPMLPAGLQFLDCAANQLTVLPALPLNTLISLDCSHNQITVLPALPPIIEWLKFANNQISTIPAPLSSVLWTFDCSKNPISSIPALPSTLRWFDCHDLPLLTSMPELPYLHNLHCQNNPNLHCLPELRVGNSFKFDSVAITCLPNYPQPLASDPPLASVPLCDVFNTHGCQVFWNISGETFDDVSANCVHDTTELNFPYLKVNLYQSGNLKQQAYTAAAGIYSFNTTLGTYTVDIDTTGIPFKVSCPAGGFHTSTLITTDSFDLDKDFALTCKSGFDVGVQSIAAFHFFPANLTEVSVHAGDVAAFWGKSCNTTNLSGQVITTIAGPVRYIAPAAGALTPSSVSGDTLTYTIANWQSVNAHTDFNIMVQTDTAAQAGQPVCITIALVTGVGDRDTSNNNYTFCDTVVNSYDPNDKQVSPVGNIDTTQEWLTYTVRFQNTGTAAAQNIYIADTLDTDLDESTFQLLAFSHEPMVQIIENRVRFNFPNINLPDSTSDEPNSHGYVQYKVKLKGNLPIGTQIENTAAIYFDFNPPVITNTTVSTLAVLTPPVAVISAAATSICAGESLTLSASGGRGYEWSTGSAATSVVVSPTHTTSYSVTVMDEHGNTATASTTITVTQPSSTILNESICAGDTYVFNSQQLTSAGIFTNTLTNAASCDSLVTLNLTVNPLPQPVITQTDDTLSVGNFASYVWLLDGNLLPYQTFQQVRVTQNGNYSVMVTDANGCTNTSAIKTVVGVGVGGLANDDLRMTIYPNPNNGKFTMEFGDARERAIVITDLMGKTVLATIQTERTATFNLNGHASGVYFVRVMTEGKAKNLRLVIVD